MTVAHDLRVLGVGNLYPPHDLGGGYELTWRAASQHLRRDGMQVRILTSELGSDGEIEELDDDVHRELRLYWREHAFPRRSLRERIAIERDNAATLRRHLAELRPHAVNWWGMGGLSLSLVEQVRRAGVPAVGVVGDEWMVWGPRADRWLRPLHRHPRLGATAERLTGLPARLDLGNAALWLFNSESVRRSVLADGWVLPRTEIVHPGIDHTLFREAAEQEWEWRLLYLGRLDPRKGLDTLIEALPLLPEHATLVVQGTGDDTYVGDLRARIDRLGLAGRVRFSQTPRNRLGEVYADADTLVFPVLWEEPWGLVPLEAMAVGRPVVATGTGGSAEYLRHEENCLLFAPRDSPAALAAALSRLAGDAALRRRLRERGRSTSARFAEDRYNSAIAAALHQEAARPRRP